MVILLVVHLSNVGVTNLLPQSALFNFQSLLLVILLFICTCAYTHYVFPAIMDRHKDGYLYPLESCHA